MTEGGSGSRPGLHKLITQFLPRLLLVAGIVALLHFAVDAILRATESSAMGGMLSFGLLALLLLAYALLIALPFVPGIEIGLSLLALEGAAIAPPLYLATLAGLSLAYWAGRRLPLDWLERRLAGAGLTRAAAFVAEVRPLSPDRRLALLRRGMPRRLAPLALRGRYLFLAVLINMPGSGLIGGGGGICFVAGLTGFFSPKATLLTLALAVAPAPLLIWGLGMPALMDGRAPSAVAAE